MLLGMVLLLIGLGVQLMRLIDVICTEIKPPASDYHIVAF